MTIWKTIIVIGGALAVFALLVLAILGVTGILPLENEKYFIALTAVGTIFLAVGTLMLMAYQTHISTRVAGLQMFIQMDTQYDADLLRSARDQIAPLLVGGGQAMVPSAIQMSLSSFMTQIRKR